MRTYPSRTAARLAACLALCLLAVACGDSPTDGRPPQGTVWRAIYPGTWHTCGITADATAYCWGRGATGMLGNGTLDQQLLPTPVAGGLRFSALAAGRDFTCGLTEEGKAYCWGNNFNAQLGDRTTERRPSPTAVSDDRRFTSLVAGYAHACGLTAGGTVYCWGDNSWWQLGNSHWAYVGFPVEVAASVPFARLVAGSDHTCGLTAAGEAYCWGRNREGQLGYPPPPGQILTATPAPVSGGHRFRSLSGGMFHTCGITMGGELLCWGWNDFGQLGDGSTASRAIPTAVPGLAGATAVAAGAGYTCALTADGSGRCWGTNDWGELGTGDQQKRGVPVPLAQGSPRFSAISATQTYWFESPFGPNHTCAITSAGEAYCWGWNDEGALGDGTRTGRRSPVRVAEPRAP